MDFQIAFAIALTAAITFFCFWRLARICASEAHECAVETIADLKESREVWKERHRLAAWGRDRATAEYQELLDFLTEQGIEVRPYKAPEIPKYELRIGNRPDDDECVFS